MWHLFEGSIELEHQTALFLFEYTVAPSAANNKTDE